MGGGAHAAHEYDRTRADFTQKKQKRVIGREVLGGGSRSTNIGRIVTPSPRPPPFVLVYLDERLVEHVADEETIFRTRRRRDAGEVGPHTVEREWHPQRTEDSAQRQRVGGIDFEAGERDPNTSWPEGADRTREGRWRKARLDGFEPSIASGSTNGHGQSPALVGDLQYLYAARVREGQVLDLVHGGNVLHAGRRNMKRGGLGVLRLERLLPDTEEVDRVGEDQTLASDPARSDQVAYVTFSLRGDPVVDRSS